MSRWFQKDITLVCKSVDIWDGIVNPIYGCRVRMTQSINPIYAGLERPCPDVSKKVWHLVNPIYGCGVKMAPYINPIYAGLERSCPRDSKNVSYVDVGPVLTC